MPVLRVKYFHIKWVKYFHIPASAMKLFATMFIGLQQLGIAPGSSVLDVAGGLILPKIITHLNTAVFQFFYVKCFIGIVTNLVFFLCSSPQPIRFWFQNKFSIGSWIDQLIFISIVWWLGLFLFILSRAMSWVSSYVFSLE